LGAKLQGVTVQNHLGLVVLHRREQQRHRARLLDDGIGGADGQQIISGHGQGRRRRPRGRVGGQTDKTKINPFTAIPVTQGPGDNGSPWQNPQGPTDQFARRLLQPLRHVLIASPGTTQRRPTILSPNFNK
jgi:hypothetical protein